MSNTVRSGPSAVLADIRNLRQAFTLVPWRMRWRAVGLLVAAGASASLDMMAVASMLPLTQMLTSSGDIPPLVREYFVPIVGVEERSTLLLAVASFVAFAFILKNVSLIAIRWWSLGITQSSQAAAQAALLESYLSAPYSAHRQRSKAVILQAISSSVPKAFGLVMLGYITIAVYGMTVILLFATLLVLAPLACLAAIFIFGGAAFLISRYLKPLAYRNAMRALEIDTDAWRILNPAIEGFRESRLLRKEALFAGRYAENRAKAARLGRIQAFLGELPKYLLEVVMVAGIFIVALVLFSASDEATAFGLLAMFAAATMRIIPSLNLLVATYNGVISGRPALEMVVKQLEALKSEAQVSRHPTATLVTINPGDIVINGLGYRYPDGDANVLSDVSATIREGATVALVGGSGAGKTTFADIVAGLLVATEGSIYVDDVDIAKHPDAWLKNIAMVSQNVYLWDAPLSELITFGEPEEDIDVKLLQDVIRRARLDSLVSSLPKGINTRIGEGGSRLSGGQAQRVGIARALYAQPRVLILDEATSALDNETEHQITETIDALQGEVTVIVIAHRLSTVKNADEILFFADGRLRSRGTMSELRETDSGFARLVELGSLG